MQKHIDIVVSLTEGETLVNYCVGLYDLISTNFKSRFGLLEVTTNILSDMSRIASYVTKDIVITDLNPLNCPDDHRPVMAVLTVMLQRMASMPVIVWTEGRLTYPTVEDISSLMSELWILKSVVSEALAVLRAHITMRERQKVN